MKIGFNMLLWTPFVTEEHFPLFGKLKAAGYDGVEIPLFSGNPPTMRWWRGRLRRTVWDARP